MRELGAGIELKGRREPINSVGRFFNLGQYSFWCRWLISESAVRSEPKSMSAQPPGLPSATATWCERTNGSGSRTASTRRPPRTCFAAISRPPCAPCCASSGYRSRTAGSTRSAPYTFNLGAGALQRSTLRRKVNREEHDAVPAEFGRWVWASGRKLKGLVRRREAEAGLYVAGRNRTVPTNG